MTKLSVNINKIATLRNARGHDNPNVLAWAKKIEHWGAQGITVHPRPDERHITQQDVYDLKKALNVELNIEGYPSEEFCNMVLEVMPAQVTLVPDKPGQLTSDHGWDTLTDLDFLKKVIAPFKAAHIRVSLFLDPNIALLESTKATGADGIELYTEWYASHFKQDKAAAIAAYIATAEAAQKMGLLINAGHDLDLENTPYLVQQIPQLAEVSIGHALVCDALEMGMEATIKKYLNAVKGI